jgi:Uma2 family endonuclease
MSVITKFSQLDVSKQYSYADYLTWRFTERVELIKGWIRKMSPAPSLHHQASSRVLFIELYLYFKNTTCNYYTAPFDVRLLDTKKSKENKDVTTVVQPDLCVVCDKAKLDTKGCIGAPDLIIEIVSPGNSKTELKTKFELYQENLVKEYWVAHPSEKNIMLFVLKNKKFVLHKTYCEDDVLESVLFKGLTITINDVFVNY